MSAARDHVVKLSAHPRASRHIRAAKGWGGLAGFGVVALLSLRAGVPAFDTGMRALGGGVIGYVVGWTAAVHVWRQLAVAELRAARRRALERRRPAEPAAGAQARGAAHEPAETKANA